MSAPAFICLRLCIQALALVIMFPCADIVAQVAAVPVSTKAMALQYVDASLAVLPTDSRADAALWWDSPDTSIQLRAGANGWVCRITFPRDRLGVNCHDARLSAYLTTKTALLAQGLNGSEARRHIDQYVKAGSLQLPPGSLEIAGSGLRTVPTASEIVIRGNHFLYFPFATSQSSGLPDKDPGDGRPWLHYAGQAEAHLMWPAASVR